MVRRGLDPVFCGLMAKAWRTTAKLAQAQGGMPSWRLGSFPLAGGLAAPHTAMTSAEDLEMRTLHVVGPIRLATGGKERPTPKGRSIDSSNVARQGVREPEA